jgi:ribosomal protein S6
MSTIKEEVSRDEKKGIYEIGYFLISSIPEEKVADIASSLKDIILKKKGEMIGEEAPEKRPLAYSMTKKIGAKNHKFTEGYFGWFKFEVETSDIIEIKKSFESNDDVLRFLLISTVKENTYLGKKAAPTLSEDKVETEKVNPEVLEGDIPAITPDIDKSIDEMVKQA